MVENPIDYETVEFTNPETHEVFSTTLSELTSAVYYGIFQRNIPQWVLDRVSRVGK